jgi:hypothetical protein
LSLIGFLGVRVVIANFFRPHYVAPLHTLTRFAVGGGGPKHGDWVLNEGWSDRFGHTLSDTTVFSICNPGKGLSKVSMFSCFNAHHIYSDTIYQPASRFWLFQGIETGIFAALSALLLGVTVWWIRYRVA